MSRVFEGSYSVQGPPLAILSSSFNIETLKTPLSKTRVSPTGFNSMLSYAKLADSHQLVYI